MPMVHRLALGLRILLSMTRDCHGRYGEDDSDKRHPSVHYAFLVLPELLTLNPVPKAHHLAGFPPLPARHPHCTVSWAEDKQIVAATICLHRFSTGKRM